MSYKVIEVFSDDCEKNKFDDLYQFCKMAASENKQASSLNMAVEDWKKNSASLLHLLLIEKRFLKNKGGLQLLYKDASLVAVSGYYQSDFSKDIYVMGVRTWVLKQDRFNLLIASYLLPYQLAEILKRSGKAAVITFNESTKSFAKLIERSNKNPDAPLKFFFGNNYPEIYKDMFFWPHPVKIKEVKQWVLIKNLTNTFSFDWSQLNWPE